MFPINKIIFIALGALLVFTLLILAFLIFKKKGKKGIAITIAITILELILGWVITKVLDFTLDSAFYSLNHTISTEELTLPSSTEGDEVVHVHKLYREKKENIVDPKCTTSGSYDLVKLCECGEEISRESITVEPIGHNYVDGVCTQCNAEDPDYVKTFSQSDIMSILADSLVSDTGTYRAYLGAESVSVFAEEQYNCFSINTAVSYNLWGGNVQEVVFNVSSLSEIGVLDLKIGGETGDRGGMDVEFFLGKLPDDSPDYTFELDASDIPIGVSIDIRNYNSMSIRVTNHSGNENKLVFYDFSKGTE